MTIRAALMIIGNEILSGRTQDVNLSHLATKMNEIGVQLAEARVVPDIESEIIECVNHLRAKYDYVFTTGGIGPTHDDITASCIAKAFEVPLIQHPEALKILTAHYKALDVELNEARLRMTMTPEGASLIDNPVSAAPGFKMGNVHVMAGVPKIMQAMLDSVLPTLKGGEVVQSKTILCSRPEGEIAEGLGRIQETFPDLDIGSYPAFASNGFRLSLVLRGVDSAMIEKATEDVVSLIDGLGGKSEIVKS